MRPRHGAPKAITAARKLALIIYHLLTSRQPYQESIFIVQEIRFRKRKEGRLRAQAGELGFQLVPIAVVPQENRPPLHQPVRILQENGFAVQ